MRPLQPSDGRTRDDLTPFLRRMGLWSLAVNPEGDLNRVATPAAEAYREAVAERSSIA